MKTKDANQKRTITVELTKREFDYLANELYENYKSISFEAASEIKFVKGLLPKFGLADDLKQWLESQEDQPQCAAAVLLQQIK
jgi:hypothetical protein